MARKRMTWNMQLVIIAGKGARARQAGLPRESPYVGRRGLNGQRMRAWLDGWDAEDREIKERGQ